MLIIIFFVYFLLIFVILINDTNYCHILQEYFLTIKFYQKGKKKKKRHCHSSDSSRKSLISLNLCCIHECEFSVTVNLSDHLFSFFNATIEIRFDSKLQCLQ